MVCATYSGARRCGDSRCLCNNWGHLCRTMVNLHHTAPCYHDRQPSPAQALAQGCHCLGQALDRYTQPACAETGMHDCISPFTVAVQCKLFQKHSQPGRMTGCITKILTHSVWAVGLCCWLHSPALALALGCPLLEHPLLQQLLLPPLQARQWQLIPRDSQPVSNGRFCRAFAVSCGQA